MLDCRLGSSFLKIENYVTAQLDLAQPKKSVASSLILFTSVLLFLKLKCAGRCIFLSCWSEKADEQQIRQEFEHKQGATAPPA